MKTSNLSADNFKTILDLDGSTPEPAIRSGDAGQRIPCFDSCQLITTLMCNICVQLASSWVPKVVRKCESKHWFSCGADGRAVGRSVYGYVITKFSGMGKFTKLWGSAEEPLQPEKSIPRSLFLIIIMSTLAYVGVSTVLTLMMPYKKN